MKAFLDKPIETIFITSNTVKMVSNDFTSHLWWTVLLLELVQNDNPKQFSLQEYFEMNSDYLFV